ncbi:HAD-IIA family hydrolase [candidate division KSB3 bacterium]|uniref:HAD-IIA family hydrolase n=1 Tax=candidate division KSB3 bacterium TaxID=2044937 RepID=A0A9D5Q5V1_9BACT|nr:HAD-IIA family hydrolase [candidate division KSB3 bacterium]MBD3325020.1 HAD-IIA family hydrolase [candidate division KSB3 bacterium]
MRKSLQKVRLFLLDLDGTFYLGSKLFPWSLTFMDTLKAQGRQHLFLTNNSSASRTYYAEKITNLGFPTQPSEVFSSTTATIIYLQHHHADARLYVLGTPDMEGELKEAGLQLVQDEPDIVLLGFDKTLTYEKVKNACYWLRAGKLYVATHPDINCPMEEGPIPDTGAMIEMIAASTGRRPDIIIGKPHPPIIDALFELYPYERNEIAMIGDRLYTDIQTGINAGIISILVLSGETTPEMYAAWEGEADFVFQHIGEIVDELG